MFSVWCDEFQGLHEVGGLTMFILHPQYTGRPSRVRMLQELIDAMRDVGGVWFAHGAELAGYALTASAATSTDGRPRSHPRGS